MEPKPKLKSGEKVFLSWFSLILSLVTGASMLGSYFLQFVAVPGSNWMLIVAVLGFILVHVLILVPGVINYCMLRFSGWSLGIIWMCFGLIFILKLF